MKNTYIMFAIALVVVAGGSFFGGMKYQESKGTTLAVGGAGFPGGQLGAGGFAGRTGRGAGGMMGVGGQRAGGGFVNGQVLSKDDKSLTIQLRDGSSKVVFYTTNSKVSKMVDGAMGDVNEGEQVSIVGNTNPDGSITAEQVQIRPNLPPPSTSTTSTR